MVKGSRMYAVFLCLYKHISCKVRYRNKYSVSKSVKSLVLKMPEEGKPDSKFVEEMYTDSGVGDKFWIKDSKNYEGKQDKERLETFIFKDCDDERVVLLMGSDCSSTEDLMMDDEVLSDWSSELLFNIDNLTSSVITSEDVNIDDHGENTKLSLTETKNKESQDQVIKDMISYNNELDKAVDESVSTTQQYSGSIPYSGSISLRSTSSTASTQSFAFPILGHECSSPVRMPKPDKRQLTKQKHWKMKMCWVCCKF